MKIIDNIYYRIYRLLMSIGEKDTPRYNAVLIFSILTILNFVTLIMVIGIITKKIIIIDLPKGYLFAIGLLIIAVNSYLILGRKHYLDIEARYKNEDKTTRRKNNLKAVLYVVLTILFLVLSLVYLNSHPIIKRR